MYASVTGKKNQRVDDLTVNPQNRDHCPGLNGLLCGQGLGRFLQNEHRQQTRTPDYTPKKTKGVIGRGTIIQREMFFHFHPFRCLLSPVIQHNNLST